MASQTMPFTCMNGIVCEAIYPKLSRDLGGIPIRNFYFDGTQSDLDRDLDLPREGAFGEMVLNVGKVVYLARKGADGIIDISPFTCMNGIVCEAIYPKLSRDLGGIPIRNFYFDGTQSDLDRDLGVYLELARGYQQRKAFQRTWPKYPRE